MIKKQKCNICNNKFYIDSKKVYQVQNTELIKGIETYDAIDCPNCSCQILLWKRLKKINKKED